jgi:hypothetical protein
LIVGDEVATSKRGRDIAGNVYFDALGGRALSSRPHAKTLRAMATILDVTR